MKFEGTKDYVATEDPGLLVVDLADPLNPTRVADVGGMDPCIDVAVAGSHAYLVGSGGLHIIDIEDPESPALVGSTGTIFDGSTIRKQGVTVAGGYAYVVDQDMTPDEFVDCFLYVIDVSASESPAVVGSMSLPPLLARDWDEAFSALDIAVRDDFVYVAPGNGRQLLVIDVSVPESPAFNGSFGSHVNGVAVFGEYAFVTSDPSVMDGYNCDNYPDSRFQIIGLQCNGSVAIDPDHNSPGERTPSTGLRLAVHPNPFNPQTTVSFSLERTEWASVDVYELTGKRVAVLADRTFTAGEHSLLWNGRDVTGRSMPSGTYLVRLETESAVRSQKLMLVR